MRELSKVMDGASLHHLKELFRVIKHILDHKELELKMDPQGIVGVDPDGFVELGWILKGLSDADFSTDADTRKSVTGFIFYLMGCPISWNSKGQGAVALSSTELEYYALSEIVQNVKFVTQSFEFLNIPVKYPVRIFVDNIGAMYLSRGANSNSKTKQIDTWVHFVRDYQEDGKF